jgi:hypothetical protein
MSSPVEEAFLQIAAADPELAEQVMRSPQLWAETFLKMPITGEPFRANYVQRLIFGSTSRKTAIRVSRRSGKSFGLVILALYYTMCHPGLSVLFIAPAGTQIEQLFTLLREFIAANSWIKDGVESDRSALPARITFSNGSKILGFTTGASSKRKAMSLRGQGGELILIDEAHYLNEEDWSSITPIMQGDKHKLFPPRTFVASTPAYTRGFYYEIFEDPEKKQGWYPIHVPITKNPDVTPEFVEECRMSCPSELDWMREYLAEFPEIGEGVFPKTMVEASWRAFDYATTLREVRSQYQTGIKPPTRTMGVDWDKYNKDGHGCMIVIVESTSDKSYRVIYREEVPQSQFTLDNAVNRVIELNDLFEPEWIYIDRGYGDYQLERLQLHGKKYPRTGLYSKVVGIQFAELTECPMPNGGIVKKGFKATMISVLRGWFERKGTIEISNTDQLLYKQLTEYHVKSQSDTSIKFSDKRDHLVCALGLACMAMHQRVTNPYAPPKATKCYVLPTPIPVPSSQLRQYTGKSTPEVGNLLHAAEDKPRAFARRRLGNSTPFERRKF